MRIRTGGCRAFNVNKLSVELLSDLRYNRRSGIFTWKRGQLRGERAGSIATKGYRQIGIAGRYYMAHRLAWLAVYGCPPSRQIDHINGKPDDNRIANLRDVPGSWNIQNRREALRNNKSSGVLGVHRWGKNWVAHIRVGGKDGKLMNVGCFDTIAKASQAYMAAKRRLHPGSTL